MYRDNPVMAYMDKDVLICRVCAYRTLLTEEEWYSDRNSALCSLKNNKCSYVCCIKHKQEIHPQREIKKEWNFDNTKHKIIITWDKCCLCNTCNPECHQKIVWRQNLYKQCISTTPREKKRHINI